MTANSLTTRSTGHTHRNDVLGCHDRSVRRHRDNRVEIAGGQRIGEITQVIREKRADQREICAQRRLDKVGLSIHFDPLLAFLDHRADPRSA